MVRQDGHHDAVQRVMSGVLLAVERERREESSASERTLHDTVG